MKDLIISKELLIAVFGHDDICNERIIQNKLSYMCENDGMVDFEYEYTIYEFASRCKEWAMNKGFQIISGLSDEPAYRNQDEKAYAKLLWYEGDDIHREYKDMYFMANTEVEAVIKASEYVLKEINEKDTTNSYTY